MKQVKKFCTRIAFFVLINCISCAAIGQTTLHATVTDQYDNPVEERLVKAMPSGAATLTDSAGAFNLVIAGGDSIQVEKPGFKSTLFKSR